MRSTGGSFQLMHMSRDDTLFNQINWSSHGSQNEDKTLLQHSQHCHKGEFRHVSISPWQWSLRCEQNLRGPFLRATLPDCALEQWRTSGRQKGSYLHHQGEFLRNCYMFVSLHDMKHEGVVRIFVALSCEPWGCLFTLFIYFLFSFLFFYLYFFIYIN